MGQRTQLIKRQKDDTFISCHQQFGQSYRMIDFLEDYKFPKSEETFCEYWNNNGYLFIDEVLKKYCFILGYEEFNYLKNKLTDEDKEILKNKKLRSLIELIEENISFNYPLDWKEFFKANAPWNKLFEKHKGKEWMNEQLAKVENYFKDYSLFTKKELQDFNKEHERQRTTKFNSTSYEFKRREEIYNQEIQKIRERKKSNFESEVEEYINKELKKDLSQTKKHQK